MKSVIRLHATVVALLAFTGLAVAADVPGKAAIASAHPLATAAGYEVLEAGGNAFDAAVAVSAALGVVEPYSSGLGGGAFWLLHVADEDREIFVDAREVAPSAATRNMYLDADGELVRGASLNGPLAAGIPGQAAGLVHLVDNYGRLPLSSLIAPAIKLAEEGFPVHRRMLLGLSFRRKTTDRWPALGAAYYPDGEPPAAGEIFRQPDLARTLRRFAAGGRQDFYAGETAERLVAGSRADGGIWTLDDFRAYRVIEREPLSFEYRGTRIVSAPPPSSGGIAIANMLNILDGYDLATLDGATRKHLIVESMRRAYRDRAAYLGDSDFVPVPVERLTDPNYAAGQRISIRMDRATPSDALASIVPPAPVGADTTHFSVIDADGNRVAGTMTINTWYGSGYMVPGTGVILNNEMDDFAVKLLAANNYDLIGNDANAIAPGKRPLSSMSPTFLESERGVAILGTPGGSRIISMVLLASLEWMNGASADEMTGLKRYHHQFMPDVISFESGALAATELSRLEELGHRTAEVRRPFGNMNVVTWDFASGDVEAATDPRATIEGRVY
ncbi:MAG: gamma-glutamyltransferase [Gammaproteobacteria bacterium]